MTHADVVPSPSVHGPTPGVAPADGPESEAVLRRRYEAYCRSQAAELAGLLPRDSVREVYRGAREAAGGGSVGDPLALLVAWCRSVLPLPPFEAWREDYRRHRGAYLELLGEAPSAPTRAEPLTVDLRVVEHVGRRWYAGLDVFRDGGAWRGTLRFHQEGVEASYRTGDVFRGDDPAELRDRFLSFDTGTLQAFLRSVLP